MMLCPMDGTELLMSERSGIEIDYCPKCRGIWLDRGELDKIIERAAQAETSAVERRTAAAIRGERDDDDDHYDAYTGKYKRGPQYEGDDYRKRKRRGFLDDVFDIFD